MNTQMKFQQQKPTRFENHRHGVPTQTASRTVKRRSRMRSRRASAGERAL